MIQKKIKRLLSLQRSFHLDIYLDFNICFKFIDIKLLL